MKRKMNFWKKTHSAMLLDLGNKVLYKFAKYIYIYIYIVKL